MAFELAEKHFSEHCGLNVHIVFIVDAIRTAQILEQRYTVLTAEVHEFNVLHAVIEKYAWNFFYHSCNFY